MKRTLIALAVALIATPALAQSAGSTAASSKPQANKNSRPIVSEAQPRHVHSTNPEYDVYFRGEYVGSDPDPRVRWTLRDEARRSYGIRD